VKYLISILLKEIIEWQGNWRLGTTTIAYLTKNGLLASVPHDDFRGGGGALHCFCPRAPTKPSYANTAVYTAVYMDRKRGRVQHLELTVYIAMCTAMYTAE